MVQDRAHPVAATQARFRAWQLRMVLLLWLAYTAFYLTRANLSVALPGLMVQFHLTRTQAGLVGAVLFWAYAVGQFPSGALGDRLSPRRLILTGLLASAGCNLLISFLPAMPLLVLFWGVNGLAQSLGWASVARITAYWVRGPAAARLAAFIGTSAFVGTSLAFLLAGLAVAAWGWRAGMWLPAVLVLVASLPWARWGRDRPRDMGLPESGRPSPGTAAGVGANLLAAARHRSVLLIAAAQVGIMVVRQGVLLWAPVYLLQAHGLDIGRASLSAVLFPVSGVLGALLAGWATDRWFGGRRAPMATLLMAPGAALLATLAFAAPQGSPAAAVLLLGAIGFTVFAADTLVTFIPAMELVPPHLASSAAGLVNGLAYIGAGITAPLVGFLVDQYGWGAGILMWCGAASLSALLLALWWRSSRPLRPR